MLKNIITAYDGSNATIEIIIMLTVAFALGYFLKKILYESSVKSKYNKIKNTKKSTKFNLSDLKIVEGIDSKIEDLLKDSGIKTLKELSKSNASDLKVILTKAGDRFALHDTSSWADQASLAVDGKMQELAKYQELLTAGKVN